MFIIIKPGQTQNVSFLVNTNVDIKAGFAKKELIIRDDLKKITTCVIGKNHKGDIIFTYQIDV